MKRDGQKKRLNECISIATEQQRAQIVMQLAFVINKQSERKSQNMSRVETGQQIVFVSAFVQFLEIIQETSAVKLGTTSTS
jgi:hypothetical protein